MADSKVTELTAITAADTADLLHIVDNVSSTPTNKKITVSNLLGVANVKNYGAIGDGVADDTTAFANTIAALGDGDMVYAPAGIYSISTLIFGGVGLRGDGYKSEHRGPKDSANYASNTFISGTVIRSTASSGTVLYFGHATKEFKSSVRDFALIGPDATTAIGMKFETYISGDCYNIKAANFGTGVQLSNSQDGSFNSMRISGCTLGLEILSTTNQNQFFGLEINQCATSLHAQGGSTNEFFGGLIQGGTDLVNGIILDACSGYAFHGFWFEATWSGDAIKTSGINSFKHRFIDCHMSTAVAHSITFSGISGSLGKHEIINLKGANIATITIDSSVNACRLIGAENLTVTDNANETIIVDTGQHRPWQFRADYDRGQARTVDTRAPILLSGMAGSGTEYFVYGSDTTPSKLFAISVVGGLELDIQDSAGAVKHKLVFDGKAIHLASVVAHDGTAIPAGGTAGAGVMVSSTANFGMFFGSGAPTLSVAKGSLYLRSDGSSTSTRAYINTDGGTTWTAVSTVA